MHANLRPRRGRRIKSAEGPGQEELLCGILLGYCGTWSETGKMTTEGWLKSDTVGSHLTRSPASLGLELFAAKLKKIVNFPRCFTEA